MIKNKKGNGKEMRLSERKKEGMGLARPPLAGPRISFGSGCLQVSEQKLVDPR